MGWRHINTDLADPYYVTAADEAITILRQKNHVPNTIHFYRRNQPTISVGRSRKIHEDIHLQNCQKYNVTIIRRTTGGGTIYTDPGCLIYSLIFNKNDTPFSSTEDIFKHICTAIITALNTFQITTQFKPPNDILLNGKKISGAGLIKKDDIILIHGTLLISTNLVIMQQVLNISSKTSVTTLQKEEPAIPSVIDLYTSIANHFAQIFQTNLLLGSLNEEEKALITQLIQTRYRKQNWTYMR